MSIEITEKEVAEAVKRQAETIRGLASFLRSGDPLADFLTSAMKEVTGEDAFIDGLADKAEKEAEQMEAFYNES